MKEEKKEKKHGAWSVGWGWILTLPLVAIASLAMSNSINSSFGNEPSPDKKAPLDQLKERYVRGEIDRNEYLEKLNDITQ